MSGDVVIYGLKKCSDCRKALKAIGNARIRDVREEPLSRSEIDRLLAALGEGLVNRRSMTWRTLTPEERQLPPAELLARWPVLMKRPVIEEAGQLRIGL